MVELSAVGVAPCGGMSVGQWVKFPARVASSKLHRTAQGTGNAPCALVISYQLILLGCESQALNRRIK